MKLSRALRVKPRTRVRLAQWDPGWTAGIKDKKTAESRLEKNISRLADLQYRLYADNRYALLIVLQGMDAAGKDGTIRHVMSRINPQGCRVTSFKAPSREEADHKWFRNLAVSEIIVETLDLRFPKPAAGLSRVRID